MGKIEKRNETEVRRTKMNKAIIASIQMAGLLSLAAVAPNAVGMLGKLKLLPQLRYRANTALTRMIQKGYVRVEKSGGMTEVRLTERGEAFAIMVMEGERKPKKSKRWDGKWRVVSYDLKKATPALRARLRELLKSFGFVLLQQSVWVYPYDCEDLIFILKRELRLGGSLLYIIADQIENDAKLRTHFSLPSRRD